MTNDTVSDERIAEIRDVLKVFGPPRPEHPRYLASLRDLLRALDQRTAERDEAIRMRDAYKRAKAENDERFQIEAATQRERAERAESERDAAAATERAAALRHIAHCIETNTRFTAEGIDAFRTIARDIQNGEHLK